MKHHDKNSFNFRQDVFNNITPYTFIYGKILKRVGIDLLCIMCIKVESLRMDIKFVIVYPNE